MPSPNSLRPMLASVAREPFDSPDHIFDVKWGGIRALAFVERARVRLMSQSGRDMTEWFPELASIAGQVSSAGAVIDGEIVATTPAGQPDLTLLAGRLAGQPFDSTSVSCVYQAYDILEQYGRSTMALPLSERREALNRTLRPGGPAVVTAPLEADGIACFEAVAAQRLPGIVAREKTSLYRPGMRTGAWVDVPVYESGWFVAGGYVLGIGRKEEPVAGILLGQPAPGGLQFVGVVQGGLPRGFETALEGFMSSTNPFLSGPGVARLVYWLRPQLVCEVRYAGRDPEGRLRFPVFVTLRPDLAIDACEPGAAVALPAVSP